MAATLRRVSGVIFISRFAKDEFCRIPIFKRSLVRLPYRVIWNGNDFPIVAPGPILRTGPWICFANQAHKRVDIAIAAFQERWSKQGGKESLLVIGRRPEGFSSPAPVEFRANLSQGELFEIFGGAKGLLFPSEYEGFGLPVLEAAVSGVPVISNDLPAVREVFGDTVCYANTNAIREYVAWMKLFDEDPCKVLERACRAWELGKNITWRRCAVDVADFYTEVCEKFNYK